MDSQPWYRQFWPWFLIALPATVVVAGLTTWWIAAHKADSLVVDDYYKEGLAINRQLRKQNITAVVLTSQEYVIHITPAFFNFFREHRRCGSSSRIRSMPNSTGRCCWP